MATDLNGDGKPDLATMNYGSRDVSVLLNRGDGTLMDVVSYPLGKDLSPLIAADLNGDGKPDLATSSRGCSTCDPSIPGEVFVLLHQGDGTFLDAVSYPVVGADVPLMAADLNDDGKPDLAMASWGCSLCATPRPGVISVLLNQGAGIFLDAVSYPIPMGPTGDGDYYYPVSLIAADLNGDEKLDLAAARAGYSSSLNRPIPGDVSVLLNRGDGTFRDVVSNLPGGYPWSLIAADLNGDGNPDLATVNAYSDNVSVLLNRGDDTFSSAVTYLVATYPTFLITADLNGDGKLDLATLGSYDLYVLFNQGDGTFQDPVPHGVGLDPGYLIAADLNGDGNLDLATANVTSGDVSVLLNQGAGFFGDGVRYYRVGDSPSSLIAADLNGNGGPDLATVGGGVASVLINQSDGTFRDAVSYRVGQYPESLIAVDFNGDGKVDLATLSYRFTVCVLLNQGDGTFRAAVSYPVDIGSYSASLIAADLNGDGKPDLATLGSQDTVSVLLNQGDGTFQGVVSYPVGMGSYTPQSLISADIDGDERPDLATANCSGDVSVFLNRGDGIFGDPVSYRVGQYPESLIAADLSGDAKPDLAVYRAFGVSGAVVILLNQGDGIFKEAVTYVALGGAGAALQNGEPGEERGQGGKASNCDRGRRPLIVADLNGTGGADLATMLGGVVSVLINQSDGTFRDAVSYLVGEDPESLIAADLNGDGNLDLATAGGDEVSILLNQGGGTFDNVMSHPTSAFGHLSLIAADLNGDRKPDLAVTNSGGSVSVLLNQTAQPFSLDLNRNGIPDECDVGAFHRGDPNSSGTTDISDGITLFGFLFLGDPPALSCKESADVNNDGAIDVSDGIYLLEWLFIGGPEPEAPGPTGKPCGLDPDPPGSPADLGCESYDQCI
ncbi:MAG: VCBS repeat-containing protein [Planctomycetes bacterium]|nr:VCBS repeat-containing protein [Planctomycetota bacterium]